MEPFNVRFFCEKTSISSLSEREDGALVQTVAEFC
jgi:hypothetical protein